MLPFILNALNLVEVPCLSLMNPSHPINVLNALTARFAVFFAYVVHTPVMVQASIAFFLLLNSPLDFLVSPTSIFSLVSTSFGYSTHLWGHLPNVGCHLLPHVVYILFFIPRALFDNPFPEYL